MPILMVLVLWKSKKNQQRYSKFEKKFENFSILLYFNQIYSNFDKTNTIKITICDYIHNIFFLTYQSKFDLFLEVYYIVQK